MKSSPAPVHYNGIADASRAEEIRKGIYRCAMHRKVSAQVSWAHNGEITSLTELWPPDRDKNGEYSLTIRIFAKPHGRKHHIETYGTDRSQWPYNPRQKAS